MKVRALRSQRYRNRALSAGDEFEASRQDARVLVALRRAEGVKDPEPEPEPEPEEPFREEQDPEVQEGLTRTDIRRMNKRELADFLRANGEDADEESEGFKELLDRALALL